MLKYEITPEFFIQIPLIWDFISHLLDVYPYEIISPDTSFGSEAAKITPVFST